MWYKINRIYVWTKLVYPKIPDYLCFTANTANSTISLPKTGSPTAVSLETSTNGLDWSTYTIWDTITLTNVWDKVYFRNTSETTTWFSTGTSNRYTFSMTGSIAWSWDVNYLINKNWTTVLVSNYCYYALFFWCTSLTTAPILTATTLTNYCYYSMFNWCTNLTTAPALKATTLADTCYANMFTSCTSLTSLPKLPATVLKKSCYYGMFYWCTSIKLSTTQTWEYQTSYRIPTTWTWTDAGNTLGIMFTNTGWTFKDTPTINTTYYTSNTVVW